MEFNTKRGTSLLRNRFWVVAFGVCYQLYCGNLIQPIAFRI